MIGILSLLCLVLIGAFGRERALRERAERLAELHRSTREIIEEGLRAQVADLRGRLLVDGPRTRRAA